MISKKVKSTTFNEVPGASKNYAVFGISLIPENDKYRICVAWENLSAAKNGYCSFSKSRNLYSFSKINERAIKDTMLRGSDMGYDMRSVKDTFKYLF